MGQDHFFNENTYQTLFSLIRRLEANVTFESLQIFKDIINGYAETYNSEDLELTKNVSL